VRIFAHPPHFLVPQPGMNLLCPLCPLGKGFATLRGYVDKSKTIQCRHFPAEQRAAKDQVSRTFPARFMATRRMHVES
jgi:hypothetical protein